MKLIMYLLVIAGLLFGGNATVAAAQDDLPNDPLYPIKLLGEDVNLWLITDPLPEAEMLMQQAQTRMEEMQALASEGITPPAELSKRAQERIQRALQIALSLDDGPQTNLLQHIQDRLQKQEQLMDQLQTSTCPDCVPVLLRTREMLHLQLNEVEGNLATPEPLQNQNQNQLQSQTQEQLRITQTAQPTVDINSVPNGTGTPVLDRTAQQNGGNASPAVTPVKQNNEQKQNNSGTHNGAGPGDDNQPSPGSGGQGGKP